MARQQTSKEMKSDATPLWEWAIAGVGAVLVAGVIVYMTVSALMSNGSAPVVFVEAHGPVERSGDLYVVRFEARNESSATAAGLRIRGELLRDGSVVEASEAVLDFLPRWSKRRGGLFFRRNPADGRVELFATGYQDP